jgi:hypothetical protein
MTVLAVPALCTAVGLLPFLRNDNDPGKDRGPEEVRREAARNPDMFNATQRADELIQRIALNLKKLGASLNSDQSINFGDDLADYVLNGMVPVWRGDNREKLRNYCQAVYAELVKSPAAHKGDRDLVTILVEGHSDKTRCKGRPDCNWYISSKRAGAFVALMRREEYCHGGKDFDLRPEGYADSRPFIPGIPTRRISLRLVPNYEKIIRERQGKP